MHRSPATSAEAFAPGAILVLPLDIASGVRMRVLEAWARGVVVVASPEAASGLAAADGRELLLARSGSDYAHAIARLATVEGLADRLIAGGRERLAADHAPERFAAGFVALVERLTERRAESPSNGPPGRPPMKSPAGLDGLAVADAQGLSAAPAAARQRPRAAPRGDSPGAGGGVAAAGAPAGRAAFRHRDLSALALGGGVGRRRGGSSDRTRSRAGWSPPEIFGGGCGSSPRDSIAFSCSWCASPA